MTTLPRLNPVYCGYLDHVDGDRLVGWLLRRRDDGTWAGGQEVSIFCDGVLIATIQAASNRFDVAIALTVEGADATCGFDFTLPAVFSRPNTSINVKSTQHDWQLSNAPVTIMDRHIWTLDTSRRSVVAAHDGLQEKSLVELFTDPDGYTVIAEGGTLAILEPHVYPEGKPYEIHCPPQYGEKARHFNTSSSYPALLISKLSKAICLPKGLLMTADGAIIDDCFQARNDQSFHHELERVDGGWALKREVAIVRRSEASVLWLDQQHIKHFGHFAVDAFSKLWAFSYLRDHEVKVLVTRTDAHWILRILALYGVSPENTVLLDEPTIFKAVYAPIRAKQVFDYVTPTFFESCRVVASNAAWEADLIDAKWFVSRRPFQGRQLVNEEAIENLFQSFGYRIMFPEKTSVDQQIAIFAHAKAIAGCSGSALYNVMYQQRLKSLIVLASPLLVIKSEHFLYADSELPLTLLIGEAAEDHPLFARGEIHSPWRIDPQLVETCLEAAWGQRALAESSTVTQKS